MATAKYGIATEWAKHLRPYGRKKFWKKIRQKNKKDIQREKNDG